MRDLLKEVLKFEGVRGALIFDSRGAVLYKDQVIDNFQDPRDLPWWPPFVESLKGFKGLEMVYDGGRIYIRAARDVYLLMLMESAVPMAMIRLNCDVLLHGQTTTTTKQKSKGFFRRRG